MHKELAIGVMNGTVWGLIVDSLPLGVRQPRVRCGDGAVVLNLLVAALAGVTIPLALHAAGRSRTRLERAADVHHRRNGIFPFSGAGDGVPLVDGASRIQARQRRRSELDPLLNEFFERSHVAACRPDLQLRVAGRAELQQERFIALILHLQVRDDLRVAAVEALGDTENRGKRVLTVRRSDGDRLAYSSCPLWRAAAMVARDEGNHVDFVRFEAPQVAVLDQVVGMSMVARIADVRAEVVHQGRIFEPLAFPIGQAVNGACLVEHRECQARDVLRVPRDVVAALGQLDGAAAPHVGDAIDLRNLSLVTPHVVEDESLSEREIAQRQLVRAEPPKDRVEQDRAGDDEIARRGSRPGIFSRLSMSRSQTSFRTRRSCLAEMEVPQLRRSGAAGGCRGDNAEAQDGAGRADDPVEANRGDLVAIAIDFVVDASRAAARLLQRPDRSSRTAL